MVADDLQRRQPPSWSASGAKADVNSIVGGQQLSLVAPSGEKAAPVVQQQAIHRRALGAQTHLMNPVSPWCICVAFDENGDRDVHYVNTNTGHRCNAAPPEGVRNSTCYMKETANVPTVQSPSQRRANRRADCRAAAAAC